LWNPDGTVELAAMVGIFPNLYCDNSALCSINCWRTAPALLDGPPRARVIHGSDYPVPTSGLGPLLGGLISRGVWRESLAIQNPFARDAFLKGALSFPKKPRSAGLGDRAVNRLKCARVKEPFSVPVESKVNDTGESPER